MNATLLKALLALVPACMLFAGSVVFFFTRKTVGSFLQVIGAGCLVGVVLIHIFEALRLFAWMHWGLEHSVGHYIDFWSAVLGSHVISRRIFVSWAYKAPRLQARGKMGAGRARDSRGAEARSRRPRPRAESTQRGSASLIVPAIA